MVRDDGKEYDTLKEAAISVNRHPRGIRLSITKNQRCGGYYFNYCNQEDFDDEIWKHHPSLPIKCSSYGRIERENGMKTFGTRMNRKANYKRVHLQSSRTVFRLVHRLIAETFLPNPENLPVVDHIDENKANNKVSNLRWCTHQQNREWYYKNRRK